MHAAVHQVDEGIFCFLDDETRCISRSYQVAGLCSAVVTSCPLRAAHEHHYWLVIRHRIAAAVSVPDCY